MLYEGSNRGLSNMIDWEKDGPIAVWNFESKRHKGKQIGTKGGVLLKNFKDCVHRVWCSFDETKEGGEAFFHLLNLCNIRCIGQE